ncbi:hypothetical protein ACLB2K_013907 [Fragaria x ananassa]
MDTPSTPPQWAKDIPRLKSSVLAARCRSLRDYIHNSTPDQRHKNRIPILRCVNLELALLESNGYMYGEINTDNITINDDNTINMPTVGMFNLVNRACSKGLLSSMTFKHTMKINVVEKLLGSPRDSNDPEYKHFCYALQSKGPQIGETSSKDTSGTRACPSEEFFTRIMGSTAKDSAINMVIQQKMKDSNKKKKGQKVDQVVFCLVQYITIHAAEYLQNVMTQADLVKALESPFPGHLLDLYHFLTTIRADLDFLGRLSLSFWELVD